MIAFNKIKHNAINKALENAFNFKKITGWDVK